jgi:predicted RNase H-like HicB family nuclease
MKYAVVIEQTSTGYSAFVPDLPGCVATGATPEETEGAIADAIRFHIEGLQADGEPVPPPTSDVRYVDAEAA